jgi:hypothetical protein
MSRRILMRALRAAVFTALAVVASIVCDSKSAQAQDYCGPRSRPDLFYNYYVAPVPCNSFGAAGAQLYISPRPTPPLVGHTYITYQPLMPHEFLYKHHRTYVRDNGPYAGLTKTHVCWW